MALDKKGQLFYNANGKKKADLRPGRPGLRMFWCRLVVLARLSVRHGTQRLEGLRHGVPRPEGVGVGGTAALVSGGRGPVRQSGEDAT